MYWPRVFTGFRRVICPSAGRLSRLLPVSSTDTHQISLCFQVKFLIIYKLNADTEE